MKCAVHSDVDAVGYCRNCGKACARLASARCATCSTARNAWRASWAFPLRYQLLRLRT